MKKIITLITGLGFTLLSPVVMAHDSHLSNSLFSGMLHPVVGIDHLIALILGGILIARLNNRQCIVTGSVTMALVLGAVGAVIIGNQTWIQSAWVEAAILFSIPLYVFLLWIQKSSQTLSITLMSLFMVAHGWAHGIEIVSSYHGMNHFLDNISFMSGFLLTCLTIVTFSNIITTSIINNTYLKNHATH